MISFFILFIGFYIGAAFMLSNFMLVQGSGSHFWYKFKYSMIWPLELPEISARMALMQYLAEHEDNKEE